MKLSPKWKKIAGPKEQGYQSIAWVKRQNGFLYIAENTYDGPDVYRMILLDDSQVEKLKKALA